MKDFDDTIGVIAPQCSLNGLTDEQLCTLAAGGMSAAEEHLAERHTRLVRISARRLFLAGGSFEDLIQEGMLGLIKAIREYDPKKEASFKTYAELCVRHRLYTCVRAAKRGKHTPLNDYISLEDPLAGGHAAALHVLDLGRQLDPELLVIGHEGVVELDRVLDKLLSSFEAKILGLYLEGLSYSEIAAAVNRPPKSVDNAVQRIRRKLANHLNHGESR